MEITYRNIRNAYIKKVYPYFEYEDGAYMNLFGIRTNDPAANTFNDYIGFFIANKSHLVTFKVYEATTDPGLYYRVNPINVTGTAILIPGQYKYKIGKHRNEYEALVQAGPVKVWRDSNKDEVLDITPQQLQAFGMFGINIHRAHPIKSLFKVDKYSAGCQVIRNPEDFKELMRYAKYHSQRYGNLFYYSLFTEDDIK